MDIEKIKYEADNKALHIANVNRMLECYNHKWKGFKGQNWIPKPRKKEKYIR